jgi:tRNA pseudouridine32 synthase/23S rRNA pseudouridine746 synthase
MLSDLILHVDASTLVIDKPAGLPVDTPRRGGDSVVARIDELKLGFKRPPVPMHRLDQDTSGCLLLARTARARAELQQAFEARQVRKFYLAVVGAGIQEETGTIDLPLSKRSSEEAGWRMIGDPSGLAATTNWRRIAVRDGHTLVEFQPVTGRTHQIRVHAREAFGRGIVGDRVYGIPGGDPSTGSGQEMLLHASRLVVPRERHELIDVTAPLPDRFGDWRDAT